jgi:amidohydrolase
VDTGRPGPEVLVMGELDSIICPAHPEADPRTGAVHSCGHHAQCAALLGIAAALTEEGMLDELSGKIRLCTVPAEELLEIEFRNKLRAEGRIKYMGGKSEFLHRGLFDGVDLAFMVHTTAGNEFASRSGSVGCIAKSVIYKGVAAHAGGSPWKGRNALYAATCGLNAINAIRETFKEPDIIRVHPIITHGGDMVNAIPETVKLESYIRGSSFDAILATNKKVNQALCGAALSIGTNIEIIDIPGYAPLVNDDGMLAVAKEATGEIMDVQFSHHPAMGSGSIDMGDLCGVMPVVHPYAPGATGKSHGSDYYIVDRESATVSSAKMQVSMLHALLSNNAERAKKIIAEFKPQFATKGDYFAYIDQINGEGDRIAYREDGVAEVRL